jgi:hypothetical protein
MCGEVIFAAKREMICNEMNGDEYAWEMAHSTVATLKLVEMWKSSERKLVGFASFAKVDPGLLYAVGIGRSFIIYQGLSCLDVPSTI